MGGKATHRSQLGEAIVFVPATGQGSGWGRDVREEGGFRDGRWITVRLMEGP